MGEFWRFSCPWPWFVCGGLFLVSASPNSQEFWRFSTTWPWSSPRSPLANANAANTAAYAIMELEADMPSVKAVLPVGPFFCTGLSTETPLSAFKPCLQQRDAGPDLPSEEQERAKLFLSSLQISPPQEQLIASIDNNKCKTMVVRDNHFVQI